MSNFTGHKDPDQHRTVGSHRAWCYDCGEWCYPRIPCPCCQDTVLLTRQDALALLAASNVSDENAARIVAMGAFHVEVDWTPNV